MTDNTVFTSVADLQRLIRGASNSQSLAMLNSVMAETIGMTMYNAVSTQHNAQMLNSAATTSTCAKILSVIGVKAEPEPAAITPPADNTTPADNSGTPTGGDTQNTDSTNTAPGSNSAQAADTQGNTEIPANKTGPTKNEHDPADNNDTKTGTEKS